ncbi:NRDE family protein [Parahaliea mediterranea]|uniref:NRDE family protein n=1 Tax=Parahaliea mediterranea TaxID=651086 RepID=UPI000E2F576F|nr:NRDE family protein [Parahaliea mediterranea]
MCLIIFAYRCHPDYPLLMAANRDEFHARPTAASGFWPARPHLLAGRDLQAGGTWMGITRGGRFAAITNFRDPSRSAPAPRSRGELPLDWLDGQEPPRQWLARRAEQAGQYAGFNLLFGDRHALWYWSNAGGGGQRALAPGLYGLSNASLDTPWPKVELGKQRLQNLLVRGNKVGKKGELQLHEALQDIVQDRRLAAPDALAPLGLGEAMDEQLSAQFICTSAYGTRATTTLAVSRAGTMDWRETSFDASGRESGSHRERFTLA